jgi:hypothetical protein
MKTDELCVTVNAVMNCKLHPTRDATCHSTVKKNIFPTKESNPYSVVVG